MQRSLPPPAVEVYQGPTHAAGSPPKRSIRLGVFVLVLVLGLAIGLGYVYSRAAIYDTNATLLTVKPKGVDQRSAAADVQHVAIQKRLLLSDSILELVVQGLRQAGFQEVDSILALRPLVRVEKVEGTNLVELHARGANPALLRDAVNLWSTAYAQRRAERVAKESGRTVAELQGELKGLEAEMADIQVQLREFRDKHDIVSLERSQNRPAASLAGMNKTLDAARERLIRAEARVAALRESAKKGVVVVPKSQRGGLLKLESQAAQLRERIDETNRRFTPAYIETDPNLKAMPRVLKELEAQIAELKRAGAKATMDESSQELAEARQAVARVELKMAGLKADSSRFSAQFQEYQALLSGLQRLQRLRSDARERLAKVQVRNLRGFPPLRVVDEAPLPTVPVWPDYETDALSAIVIAVAVALFVAWLLDYLTHRANPPRSPSASSVTGVRILSPEPALPGQRNMDPRLEATTPAAALPHQESGLPRTLGPEELVHLLQVAAPEEARRIALLLSGATPTELPQLGGCAAEAQRGRVQLPDSGRELFIGAGARALFTDAPDPAWPDDDLDAKLPLVAADAGLEAVAEISAAAIRHSYVLFLVQQGARLQELAGVVGDVAELARYAPYSPHGRNLPMSDIELEHPALVLFAQAA